MDASRPASPEEPPQDLWSSILDSVSTTRSIPSKQVLLLGQASSGKSTLVSGLLQKSPSDDLSDGHNSDFALGYDWADVRDDADEDTLARLSVYTIPSSATSYSPLLPHFAPPRVSLPHTLIVITLDWTRPWTFVQELETWLKWIETWVKGDASREAQIAREESRERLQFYWQHYSEPAAETTTTALSNDTVLPLGPGTLTHNAAGVPIIVTCTKADLIDENDDVGGGGMTGMVKGKTGMQEDRTDEIMQVLRTICLKYGAALFYTTTTPSTLQLLRQYALHLLFTPPAPSPSMASSDAPVSVRNPFPFTHKPNILDRDRIAVPAGWDSWGKIAVLRDGFDAKLWGDAWEQDLEPMAGGGDTSGARRMYAALVPDQGVKPAVLPPLINPTPEQAFLARNYDENAKKPDRDPRGAFRSPTDMPGVATAGVVGPLGSSSFNLPHVEKALADMEVGIGTNSNPSTNAAPDAARRASVRPAGGRPSAVGVSLPAGRSTASPTLASSPSPTSGQTQHEVLQNFFQSLLTSKAGSSTSRSSAAAKPVNGGSAQLEPAAGKEEPPS